MTSRYSLVIAVSKRAKQLKEGAPKLVDCKSRNPITIALEEIASGKLKILVPTPEEIAAASKRPEIPTRPGARETAELLRVPEAFEDEVEEEYEGTLKAEAELTDLDDVDTEESNDLDEFEMSAEIEEEPALDENMGAIESEE